VLRLTQSSDIERIAQDEPEAPAAPSDDDSDDDDQRANDQKLTELLSTTLFAPGSSHSTNKKRKLTTTTNETLARVLELSNADTIQRPAAGSPWAENELKKKELGKMPARIRQGLRRAAGERRDREIETQKELGLWNPKVQKQSQLTRGSSVARGSKATQPKQRQRGIGSGVGHYRGGVLHLSDRDVQRIRQMKR